MSLIDAYSGYNQIKMDPVDAPKKDFMSNHGNHYYNVMPFGLNNVGATYQLLMDAVFSKQIGHNLNVYINDMTVKTSEGEIHATDLEDIM